MHVLVLTSAFLLIIGILYYYIIRTEKEFQSLEIGDKIYIGKTQLHLDEFNHVYDENDIEVITDISYDGDQKILIVTNKDNYFSAKDYRHSEFGIMKLL